MNAGQRRIWSAAALLSLLLGAWLLLRPWPVPPALVAPRSAAPPALPGDGSAARDALQDAATQLATSTLWGPRPAVAAQAASAAAAPEPLWRLQGVIEVGGQAPRALLHYDDNARPAQLLSVGDRLPDGRVLVAVSREGLRVRHTPASLRAAHKAAPQQARPAQEEWLPLPRRALAPNR